jgi:transcriptional regulator with XRE-family HTH domain
MIEHLGTRLRRLRLQRDLTQTALAKAAGISKGFYCDVETNGKNIGAANLAAIADVLGASMDDLMNRAQPTPFHAVPAPDVPSPPPYEPAMSAAQHEARRWQAACAALTGLLAADAYWQTVVDPRRDAAAQQGDLMDAASTFAQHAVELADALLAAYTRQETPK